MVTAHFRFVGRLNIFLDRHRRHSDFSCVCAREATVKHMIEALGVPHTEVTSLLINGKASEFDTLLREGDRVVASDAGAPSRSKSGPPALPPGRPRFIADAHLGGLARMLRMAGFDTLYDNGFEDARIAALAAAHDRIVLTRDRDLLKRRMIKYGCYVHALKAPAQLTEMFARLALQAHARPFTLCLHCNTALRPAAWETVQARLPPAVRAGHTQCRACDSCGRVFWQGSHWERWSRELARSTAPLRNEPAL